jgi:hypothetical protein
MSEEILNKITEAVEQAVDTKINGKLIGIKKQLDNQDDVLKDVKELLKERTFLIQLWSFVKFLGGIILSLGSAYLLYKKIK